MKPLELLSPAKNLECGLAAINHGADAVYIGAPHFSARATAGNSVEDIEQLVKYAHRFRAKVLVALNTVLTDQQLPQAERLIKQVYEAGADALIVQDMGILKLDIPPIALHASTQTDNRDLEKIKFLEKSGFSRIVLARELSLTEIENIRKETTVELEAFVHGALCVSYSGQCYISQAMCGRSANRGECAQFCRLPYDLVDSAGNTLIKNRHLLSLKDLNLSERLEDLIQAGITSFKIEGRMKDVGYVKNVTAYYRKRLDDILENKSEYKKSSVGKTTFFFEPNPYKSFNRGFTDYFITGRQDDIIQPNTPKFLGECVGTVLKTGKNSFEQSTETKINNGDGLCYINKEGVLDGFRANRVENGLIYLSEGTVPDAGAVIYRNFDADFEKRLQQKTAERKVLVDMLFEETAEGFLLRMTDEDEIVAELRLKSEKQQAAKPEQALENIKSQLSKLGNTIYKVRSFTFNLSQPYFIPNSLLSEWRRQAVEELDHVRDEKYERQLRKSADEAFFPLKQLSYLGNVTNELSRAFYLEHGVESIQQGFEMKKQENVPLMFCRHCIKHTMGWCPKKNKEVKLDEPLFLKNKGQMYKLDFDCKKCEMRVSIL
ncbi:U32 family peptidase [Paludibacter sp. 221]|uniref:peptidase U32 family protein n=1 Tax=Paludibacter sp. 221 TaxID=2302939 RepID=UPI0013D57F3C|nr:U32 family peptidase [Paludibacter sp. 221]NDV47336.1 U32 family peptidase [Paludibacter sp. 221]